MTAPKGPNTGGPSPTVLEVSFYSDPAEVRRALDDIGVAIGAAGATALVENCRIVLAEVFNNIVEHAYGGQSGKITAHLTCSATRVACVITDSGGPMPGFLDLGRRFPEIDPTELQSLPEGGFGWALVRHLAHDLRYDRTGGVNRLRFEIG